MTREEAIKILNERYNSALFSERKAFEILIPELAESEDEKIRKGMIRFLNSEKAEDIFTYEARQSWIAWLEKQKEQKPTEWSEEDAKRIKQLIYNTEAIRDGYEKKKEQLGGCFNDELIKDCDEQIAWLKSLPLNLKKKNEDVAKLCSNEWSEEDEERKQSILLSIGYCKDEYPNKKDYSKDIDWLKFLPGRFNLEPKEQKPLEWSEEDRNRVAEYLHDRDGGMLWSKATEITSDILDILHPQSKDEIYKEKNEAFKLGKHQLAIEFMNYLDENRLEGKMSLSNGECEDIDKAFKENDWTKIMWYAKKYLIQSEQKPVESISHLTVQGKGVYKICPRCKERMVRDDSKVYTSMPPQYGYECPKCGEIEFDTTMYDNPEMEEQKPTEYDEYKIIKKHITEDSLSSEVNKRLTECGWYVTDEKPTEWSEDIIRRGIKEVGLTQHQIDWLKSNVVPPKQE